MSLAVLALPAGVVTASGCVWYLPALADLRAGADRPAYRRTAAMACLAGWTTVAVTGVLLLVAGTWRVPAAVAVTGATATACLRIRAGVRRRREEREAARHWAQLLRPQPLPDSRRERKIVATLICFGPAAAMATAALAMAAGPQHGNGWLAISTWPSVVVALCLAIAVVYVRAPRR